MANPESGKQRAGRIPLDYFRRPNRLERWKHGLALGALGLAVGWPLLALVRGDEGQRAYMRGPVANVHASFESDCQRCHVPFEKISGPALAQGVRGWEHGSSLKCRECHLHDGGTHHQSMDREPACASCHRDHRGRDASLVRIPDADCTQCHANLAAHTKGGKSQYANTVTHFAPGTHPEFRLPKADPGKLKFNHALHLAPGMKSAKGDPKWTLERVAEPYRDRYRANQDGLVQLTCASCHTTDLADLGLRRDQVAGLPGAALVPAGPAGAYMLPITYENQCKACHPLTVPSNAAAGKGAPLEVPHRLQPDQLHEFLQGAYTRQYVNAEQHPGLFDQFLPTRPLPGKVPVVQERQKAADLVNTHVLAAEKILFAPGRQTCSECHYYTTPAEHALAAGNAPKGVRIEPPSVRAVWLKDARFDHVPHRALDCKACHEQASTSTTEKDVLIPGMDNCLKCHAPRTVSAGEVRGGARVDCVECHLYHHDDASFHGRGSLRRAGREGGMTLKEFLGGR